MTLKRTPLDAWLAGRLGLSSGLEPGGKALDAYRLDRLRRTVALARENSPFYRERLAGLEKGFPRDLSDYDRLGFTTSADLRKSHLDMLCVSRDLVARVVTLATSGTTDRPKRLYFSDEDLELTLDFFRHGMSTMVRPGDVVLILLPGSTPDSVGDLLARALARMGVRGVVHGPLGHAGGALEKAAELGAGCLVGIPVHVLAMAEHARSARLAKVVKSVLLTTDYVPQSLARRVAGAWSCEVFEHYGMTETGLGGGVDCRAHQGYHLRAADLYFEVVDPKSGELLPPGFEGELVMSTLTRRAMPLLRYRTGDRGRLLAGVCACGGFAPRLARVPGRLANRLDLGGGASLPMWEMDEALFALPGLLDYRAGLAEGRGSLKHLDVRVRALPGREKQLEARVRQALERMPSLAVGFAEGGLASGRVEISDRAWEVDGTIKRTLASGD